VARGRITVHDDRVTTVSSERGDVIVPVQPEGDAADESADSVSRRAERAVVVAVVAIRATFCAQLALAVPHGLTHATSPWLFGLLSALALAESSSLAAFAWRRRRITGAAAIADLGFACLVIAAEPFYSSPADRVGTWVAWGFGAGCAATLTVGTGLRRRRDAGAAAAVLAAAYLVVSASTPRPATAVVNSVALIGFVTASHLVANFLRELAAIADHARAAAASAAREAERERQRRLLHDQATVLALLSHHHDDPVLEGNLRIQAAAASRRVRAFLGDTRIASTDAVLSEDRPLLVDIVAAATADFSDLPITVNTDLVPHLRVRSQPAELLLAAIRTLLHNARRHAKASTVTIHGDLIDGARWELSITDDGVGFDPATTPLGYGLSTQAGHALTAAGFTVALDSAPGEGTRITITSPEGH
jgi:signal transduction histidine kinase